MRETGRKGGKEGGMEGGRQREIEKGKDGEEKMNYHFKLTFS